MSTIKSYIITSICREHRTLMSYPPIVDIVVLMWALSYWQYRKLFDFQKIICPAVGVAHTCILLIPRFLPTSHQILDKKQGMYGFYRYVSQKGLKPPIKTLIPYFEKNFFSLSMVQLWANLICSRDNWWCDNVVEQK